MFIVDVVGLLTHKGYADKLNTRGTLCFKVIKYAPIVRDMKRTWKSHVNMLLSLLPRLKIYIAKNFAERIFRINEWLYHLNKTIIFGILRVCNTHSLYTIRQLCVYISIIRMEKKWKLYTFIPYIYQEYNSATA